MDARALVYLRLCLGVHILMDINTRLDAGGLAFYVSEPKEEAALHPNDTPHKHFLHNEGPQRSKLRSSRYLHSLPSHTRSDMQSTRQVENSP